MRDESTLHRRAREAGVIRDWTDAAGRKRRVGDETLAAVLDALGELTPEAGGPLVTAERGEPVALPSGRRRRFEEPGYHEAEGIVVAVAPTRAWTVADAAPGRRIWGAAVQVPSLRDRRGEAFGDFESLARFSAAAGRAGADALAISPVHALFPSDPRRYGPYGPSTRLFLNVWLADPGGPAVSGGECGELIDWPSAICERMARLRRRFERRPEAERDAVEAFRRERGGAIERHAMFDALAARFGGGWRDWPAAYRDPASGAVAAFARERSEEVEFFLYLQWLADRGLAEAQATAKRAGMAVGLIADLAVGMDAGGSHGWSRPGALLSGLSVGAPPDPLGPDGQDWGITSFSPVALRRTGFADFIATIRAALRHAGGVRIDHAMGLQRLWVVPHGFPATEGAYLAYPGRDMMRLLALESWRAQAIVVGEDLGTVPPGFREEMAARGLLGMRVLWFERTGSGGFTAPSRWDRRAVAMTSTHDLPTLAGWWSERDIDWTWTIGRTSAFASEAEERAARGSDRARLWRAIGSGPRPPKDAPAQAVTAAIAHVGRSACHLALFPTEDLLGVTEQPNLPGTTQEHPNWRRRLPGIAEDMLEAPDVAARIERLNTARRQ
jgi:4-alpha-glucanotransferase